MSAPSRLAVVVPTHERRAILDLCLGALAAQTDLDFRVVVVDDGSTDGTSEWLASRSGSWPFELTALRQENAGQGAARNRALAEVEGGLVLFLGDDILAAPNLVAEHRRAHAESAEPRAIVGFIDWKRSAMKVTPALEFANREGHQFGFAHMRPGGEVPYTCFYSSNVSLPRELLGDRPFDPAFRLYGWEDVELGYRLARRGTKLFYRPEAAAEHLHPMTLGDLYRRQVRVGEAFHSLLALHPGLAGEPHFTPASPPRWMGIARLFVPPLVPILSGLDGLGLPLGKKALHAILITGYYTGFARGAA